VDAVGSSKVKVSRKDGMYLLLSNVIIYVLANKVIYVYM